MSRVLDLTGQRFGRLVVLHRGENYSTGAATWFVRCDCGRAPKVPVHSTALRQGLTRSCGCRRAEMARERACRIDRIDHRKDPSIARIARQGRAQGLSARAIAREAGVSHVTISRWIREGDLA